MFINLFIKTVDSRLALAVETLKSNREVPDPDPKAVNLPAPIDNFMTDMMNYVGLLAVFATIISFGVISIQVGLAVKNQDPIIEIFGYLSARIFLLIIALSAATIIYTFV